MVGRVIESPKARPPPILPMGRLEPPRSPGAVGRI